jgi:hypothetical protein
MADWQRINRLEIKNLCLLEVKKITKMINIIINIRNIFRFYRRIGHIIIPFRWSAFDLMATIGGKEKGETISFGNYMAFTDYIKEGDELYSEIKRIHEENYQDTFKHLLFFGVERNGNIKFVFKEKTGLTSNPLTSHPLDFRSTFGWKSEGKIII